ncbi:MAG: hypothetical protein HKO64_05130 [Xanthomonadales bacterium]|nr:hypothetical protein [Xanthomonadales bacterium]NNL94983.1 hypothetical protein [Xanthomonadales bacterium]
MNFRSIAFSAVLLGSSGAWADVTEELTYTYGLDHGGRISLENINGKVTVIGGSGTEVEIVAVKKAGTQEYLDKIEILIDHSGDALRIETDHPDRSIFNWSSNSSGSVTYTLRVPENANLESIESVNGDVHISGVSGIVKASTVNGRIEASDLRSDAKIETVNGSVEATFASFDGNQKADCETVNGRMVVNLPSGSNARVKAETINGGIDGSDFGLKTNKGFVGRDLDGSIGNGAGRLDLSTVNGAIKIKSK